MIVVSAQDEACTSYYTHNALFDHTGGNFLIRFLQKRLDTLRYFWLERSAYRIGTDAVLTAIAFYRYSEVDWGKLKSLMVFYM